MFLRFFVILNIFSGCNPQVNTKLSPPAKEKFVEQYAQVSNSQSVEGNTSLLGQEQVDDVKKGNTSLLEQEQVDDVKKILNSQDNSIISADNKEFDLSCQTDEDCVFVNRQTKETPCCAFDNTKDDFIAVNREKVSHQKCNMACIKPPSFGPQAQNSCVNSVCTKIMPPPESTPNTQ